MFLGVDGKFNAKLTETHCRVPKDNSQDFFFQLQKDRKSGQVTSVRENAENHLLALSLPYSKFVPIVPPPPQDGSPID
jgi:hypothetical protein